MKNRMIAIVLLLLALFSVSSAQSNWVAWVYTPTDGSIMRVNAAGAIVDAYRLPLSQAFNTYGTAAVASPSGRFIAYTAYDSTASSEYRQLFVYDTRVGILRFTYDLSGVSEIDFERLARVSAFDEASQTFAFGVLRGGTWELVLANLAADAVIGGQPLTGTVTGLGGANSLPVVLSVSGERVRFLLMPIGTGGQRSYPVYAWRPGEAAAEVGQLSELSDSAAGGGEVITPLYDTTQPTAGDPNSPSLAYNAIDSVAPDGSRTRLADMPDVELAQVWSIADGRQILARAFSPQQGETVLRVIGRDGSTVGELAGDLSDIHATPVGFAGLFASGGGTGLAAVESSGANFYALTVWTSSDPGAQLILVE